MMAIAQYCCTQLVVGTTALSLLTGVVLGVFHTGVSRLSVVKERCVVRSRLCV